jgi:hypothetical protein
LELQVHGFGVLGITKICPTVFSSLNLGRHSPHKIQPMVYKQ